ncbi:MAG: dihydrodipicolinate synthase family protein [Geodermatophilaceae bacterium]|nr:dihydrodipicolinate synthase family protein [Geodermatophilaceae bacterium]
MTERDDVDHAGLTSNLHWMNGLGLSGYLLLGSTGEQVHLSEFERALVLEIGRRHIPTGLILIAGTGQMSTRATIEESRRAAEAGADVALVVTPSYYQKAMTANALAEHYRAVADASPIPVMLYSVPGITGITIPPAVVAELAGHPNIVGMKNSGSDPQVAAAYRAAAGDAPFVILAGSATASPGLLLTGLCDGVILAAANVLPEATVALVQAAQQGDLSGVRHHGAALHHASEQIGRFGIAGWKAGIAARGLHGGPARPPLRNLTSEERHEIEAAVREWQTA